MCIFTAALSKSTPANARDLKVKQPNALGGSYYCLVGRGKGEKKKKKKKKDGDKENNLPVFSSLWWDCEGLGLWAELLCVFKTVYIQ